MNSLTLGIAAFMILLVPVVAKSIDLAGEWKLALDPGDTMLSSGPETLSFNDRIRLPGTTAEQRKGTPFEIALNLEKPAMQHLFQRYPYLGAAWYQRQVEVPDDWAGKDAILSLERVLWESRVWVNGRPAGAPCLSLCTPHRHRVGHLLKPGVNTITLRIDNREMVKIGTIGHAYTEETQTIWNGVIGRLQLDLIPQSHLSRPRITALPDGTMRLVVRGGHRGEILRNARIEVLVRGGGREEVFRSGGLVIGEGEFSQALEFQHPSPALWSEFNPVTYEAEVRLTDEHAVLLDKRLERFGFRKFAVKGRQFYNNGQAVFLRGNLECAIFPATGHPDAEGAQWEKIYTLAKAHGLNHLRFHSWCPPEIAFDLADRYGIFLQVELPNWTFRMGQDPACDRFFRDEGERILSEYANHPSLVMFSLGNELLGDTAAMDDLVKHFRAIEPELLFTSTSYSFSPRGLRPGAADDYFISQETASGWVRGQGFLNSMAPNTDTDYVAGLSSMSIPLITHEVGQYVVYPDLSTLPKYESTPLRATALEAIRADLMAKQRLDEAARYTRDSGKLAALLYKEDMERALRTPGLAGIQLLQLQDFPGQSTATVGLLDAFWDSKGLISPEDFSRFAGPAVPLARIGKMVWENSETFTAKLEIANFGRHALRDARVFWSLSDERGRLIGGSSERVAEIPIGNGIQLGRISQSLRSVDRPSVLTLAVGIEGTSIRNSWNVWVYPEDAGEAAGGILILESPGPSLTEALAAGRNVLLVPPKAALRSAIDARFIPVFWSPLHFPDQPGTLGATIDADHPVFTDFPTDTYTQWQWWELFATSYAMDLDCLREKPSMPLRFIDKYNRNALPAAIWEARVGPGKLLVCTLDITTDSRHRLAARQLRRSIVSYMKSDRFSPRVEIESPQLASLFKSVRYPVRSTDFQASHPSELAVDGDASTFWHTDWTAGPDRLPAWLSVDLGKEVVVSGFRYTPRQDMDRGRISRYRVEVSRDGTRWLPLGKEGGFPNTSVRVTVDFKNPIKVRWIRLVALGDHGRSGSAAIAEFEPELREVPDVRELGIVPGFND